MRIELNGRAHDLDGPTTLTELIEAIAGSTRGSAVVVDDAVIPRSQWGSHRLAEGERVELITAVQGG
jgi:sulfur carrier protein